jgi:glycosyltransferase involved in cell wall biosynthesis
VDQDSSRPLVSVIIPNYNYAHYLREAIESVLHQTYKHIEVIVVDDGSSDRSVDEIAEFSGSLTLIRQRNAGVSRARNAGLRIATGEYVAFLDSDDIWLPRKLERQVELFESDPQLGLVHVGVEEVDGQGRSIVTVLNGCAGDGYKALITLSPHGILGGGSGAMVRRATAQSVGGFDERFSTSADWEFFARVCRFERVGFVAEVLMKYRKHGSNMHSNVTRMASEMQIAHEEALARDDRGIARRCRSKLHRVLAGSFFANGEYERFVKHSVRCLANSPMELRYFAAYPVRWYRRRLREKFN